MWRLSLGRVSEPSHSLEQNCSVCSLSLPENCSLSLIIAENRQSKEEKLSPLLLGQRAASLQPDILCVLPVSPSWQNRGSQNSSRCWWGWWHRGKGAGLEAGQVLSPWDSGLHSWLSLPSFQATFQPRWRAPYGVLFPSQNTRHIPCLSDEVSV